MTDIFREVDEELQQDKLREVWQRVQIPVYAGIALLVIGVAGFSFYSSSQQRAAAEASAGYFDAIESVENLDLEGASQKLEALAETAPDGYESLARLRMAEIKRAQGDDSGALALYDGLSTQAEDAVLRQFAAFQAALVSLEAEDQADAKARLDQMIEDESSFILLAKELRAVLAIQDGDLDVARSLLEDITDSQDAPLSLSSRAAQIRATLGSDDTQQ